MISIAYCLYKAASLGTGGETQTKFCAFFELTKWVYFERDKQLQLIRERARGQRRSHREILGHLRRILLIFSRVLTSTGMERKKKAGNTY